ncbi:MAG: ribbon-helix-helix protein, CopG family [Chloroflexi bacterium]|nr:ribbon-helix-helix protein, CopG family [Chloroflexota bacterium]
MKRTQIYLSDDLYETLRRTAFEQRKSIAQIAREALETHLGEPRVAREQTATYAPRALPTRTRRAKKIVSKKTPRRVTRELKDNPLYQMIGIANSGLGDLAENHDYYLLEYEKRKRK